MTSLMPTARRQLGALLGASLYPGCSGWCSQSLQLRHSIREQTAIVDL